ncbi:MAG: hypothetical protein AAF403_03470, partial [Pseudomonadota bacterium]
MDHNKHHIIIYVQSLLGVGHLVRMARIAEAVAHCGYKISILNGSLRKIDLNHPYIKWVQLPGLKARDVVFSSLTDEHDHQPSKNLWQKRHQKGIEVFDHLDSGVFIVEGYPFARGSFHAEISAFLKKSRAKGFYNICSVRDIIVSKQKTNWAEQTIGRLNDFFDELWIHGDADFIDFGTSFLKIKDIHIKKIYTGYVVP